MVIEPKTLFGNENISKWIKNHKYNFHLSSEVPLTPLVNSGLSSSRHQLMLWGLVFSVSRDGVHTITRPRSGWFKRYPSGRSSFKSGSPTSLQQTARDKCPWWYKLPKRHFLSSRQFSILNLLNQASDGNYFIIIIRSSIYLINNLMHKCIT